MPKRKQTYGPLQIASCLVMLLALVWLTISLPFVNEFQQTAKQVTEQAKDNPEEDGSNPLTNTTEEKSETGVNVLSEYLHEHHTSEQHSFLIIRYYKCHPSDIYFAFHPDLFSPPPEA